MKTNFTETDLSLFSETFGELLIMLDTLGESDPELFSKIYEHIEGRFGMYSEMRFLALKLEEERNWDTGDNEEVWLEHCSRFFENWLNDITKQVNSRP